MTNYTRLSAKPTTSLLDNAMLKQAYCTNKPHRPEPDTLKSANSRNNLNAEQTIINITNLKPIESLPLLKNELTGAYLTKPAAKSIQSNSTSFFKNKHKSAQQAQKAPKFTSLNSSHTVCYIIRDIIYDILCGIPICLAIKPNSSHYSNLLNICNQILTAVINVAVFLASVLNGYIFFAPAEDGFKKVFDRDPPWGAAIFCGISAFAANTLLSIDSINALVRFANPIDYKQDISKLLDFTLEYPRNFYKNLKNNTINLIFKIIITLVCILVALSFNFGSLGEYYKDGALFWENILGIGLFILSNLISSGIYQDGWLSLSKQIMNDFKHTPTQNYATHLTILFKSLSSAHFRQEFILAYNEIQLEPFFNEIRQYLLAVTHVIHGAALFDKTKTYSVLEFKNQVKQAIPNGQVAALLINAYTSFTEHLKAYIARNSEGMQPFLASRPQISYTELITIYYENSKIPLPNQEFIQELLEKYILNLMQDLKANYPDKKFAGFSLKNFRQTHYEPLTTAATFELCLIKLKTLPSSQQKNFLACLLKNNPVVLDKSLLTALTELKKLKLSNLLALTSVVFTTLSSTAILAAGYNVGEIIAAKITKNSTLIMLLAIIVALAGVLGRLGIFIQSGFKLSNYTINYFDYSYKPLKKDIKGLRNRWASNMSNDFIAFSNIAISIGHLFFKITSHLLLLLLVAPSPLGYAGVCKESFESWSFIPQWFAVNAAFFAFVGAFLVNSASIFDFFIDHTNYLQKNIDTFINYLLEKMNIITQQDLKHDKKSYWQLCAKLTKVAKHSASSNNDADNLELIISQPETIEELSNDKIASYNTF